MPKFYVETHSSYSDIVGPIDPKTGWPTVHQKLITEAENLEAAQKYFIAKLGSDVLEVIPLDIG